MAKEDEKSKPSPPSPYFLLAMYAVYAALLLHFAPSERSSIDDTRFSDFVGALFLTTIFFLNYELFGMKKKKKIKKNFNYKINSLILLCSFLFFL